MLFQRSPRAYLSFPTQEVEIQSPPGPPTRPASSLIAVLIAFAFTLVGLGLSVALLAGQNFSFLFLSLPLMAGSAMVGLINYFGERNHYRREIERREALYTVNICMTRVRCWRNWPIGSVRRRL